MLTRHSSVFQIVPWNWKHLTSSKVQGKKVFWKWYYIVTCATLCLSFSSKYKAINIFTKRDLSIQARKKLFCHVIVKNYLCNVSWKFLIKIKSTRRCEIKKQAPELTLLYCGRTVKIHRNHLCWSLFLKKLQTFRPAFLLKREPNTGVFLWILKKT